jgi:peptidoglycan/LPS O-acetylase OafA/YrhL
VSGQIKAASTSRFSRLSGVDALRGAAALGVVLYHTVGPDYRFGPRVLNWLALPILPMIRFGYVGVFLFFVISGFCIHLSRARAQVEDKQPVSFTAFWKRRFRRLYPPYLIALILYLGITAFTTTFQFTPFYVWDVVSHLLMLHNLDSHTVYSINGVFWTLAIEEQLYLAYFLLLFLRHRWGWQRTLVVCLIARVLWFVACTAIHERYQLDIPISEAAASHWFTWALGALSVEAMFGLVKLPRWLYRGRLALIFLAAAVGLTFVLPKVEQFSRFFHDSLWLFLHPLWGLGFFVLLNRFVLAESRWRAALRTPFLIKLLAGIGLFSYSLYLTHELVVMESYQFGYFGFSQLATAFLLTTPACVAFAWVFFWFAERPYLNTKTPLREHPLTTPDAIPTLDA